MVTPAVVRLIVVLLALLAGSSIAPVVFAQETAVPAASPAVQQAVLAATPIAGGGRVFALPNGGGFPEGVAYDEATGDFYVGSTVDGTIYRGNVETGTVAGVSAWPAGTTSPSVWPSTTAAGCSWPVGILARSRSTTPPRANNSWRSPTGSLPTPSSTTSTSVPPAMPTSPTRSTRCSFASRHRRSPPEWAPRRPSPRRMRWRSSSTSPRPASIWCRPGSMPTASSPRPTGGISSSCRPIPARSTGSTPRPARRSRSIWGRGVCRAGMAWSWMGRRSTSCARGQITRVELSPDYASGTVGASFTDPSFTDPTTLARFDGCLLVVNSQFSQQQGQPQLPFTVSSVPIPGAGGAPGTPVGHPSRGGKLLTLEAHRT